MFFYCSVSDAAKERPGDPVHSGSSVESVGCAAYFIELYGVRRFLADLDRDREYWREADTLAHTCLSWAANEGLLDVLEHFQVQERFASPADYRNRHIDRMKEDIVKALTRR